MYFKKKVIINLILIFSLLILTIQNVLADPFSEQWEFDNPKRFGSIKKISEYTDDNIRYIYFNKNGQRVKESLFDTKKNKSFSYEFIYNSKGLLQKISFYDKDNNKLWEEIANYNSKNLIESISRDKEKGLFTYDENNNINKITFPSRKMLFDFSFDKSGYLLNVSMGSETGLIYGKEVVESYNSKGFPEKAIKYNSDKKLVGEITFYYKYDKVGNWIEKNITSYKYKNSNKINSLNSIVKRKIEYY